jgi:hypothetical protein
MSYNDLPLDSKPLQFQQIKHLLDYNQLVSITFDAHEKIIACRAYLDQKMQQLLKNNLLQKVEKFLNLEKVLIKLIIVLILK